jgi:anaerobic selenocysteine-containing dehydrogenase
MANKEAACIMDGSAIERSLQSPGRVEVPGFCTFCRSRCGSLNVIEGGRLVEVKPLQSHPTGKALCPKGRAAPEVVHDARRLMTPLVRTGRSTRTIRAGSRSVGPTPSTGSPAS